MSDDKDRDDKGDDLPISKMMGEAMRKKINGKLPPKRPGGPVKTPQEAVYTGRRG